MNYPTITVEARLGSPFFNHKKMNNFQIVNQKGEDLALAEVMHPGELIEEELQARGISKKDFAAQLGLHPSQLSELIKGKRHVSAMLALKLEKLWDISAGFWMRMQVQYDLTIARQQLAEAV